MALACFEQSALQDKELGRAPLWNVFTCINYVWQKKSTFLSTRKAAELQVSQFQIYASTGYRIWQCARSNDVGLNHFTLLRRMPKYSGLLAATHWHFPSWLEDGKCFSTLFLHTEGVLRSWSKTNSCVVSHICCLTLTNIMLKENWKNVVYGYW